MAATKTASIKIGHYTKQVTKVSTDRQAIVDQCRALAMSKNLMILVKRDFFDRWQGFARRRSAGGARFPNDYKFISGTGRIAKRTDLKVNGGALYIADTKAATGEVEVEVVNLKE